MTSISKKAPAQKKAASSKKSVAKKSSASSQMPQSTRTDKTRAADKGKGARNVLGDSKGQFKETDSARSLAQAYSRMERVWEKTYAGRNGKAD